VARNLGKKLGVLVLLLDALKGVVPVALVKLGGLEPALGGFALPIVGWAAIVGHCFPVWLGFRGGKGVATSLGVLAVAAPLVTLICAVGFVVVVALGRIVSVGSLAATALFPLVAWLLGRPHGVVWLGIGAFAIVLVKHHENIRRLLRGTEN
jgi:glycerol-3-phosphate acyltransferase PlsY